MKKLKFAIIGCGRISYKHVEALVNNFHEAILVAACDVIKERAEEQSQKYEKSIRDQYGIAVVCTAYDDYKIMIANEEIDVVTIATESGYHAQISIECLRHGKHVLVEKPMAMTLEDADRMIEIAEKNHLKLCICHQNRFNPVIQLLRKAVEEGRFGRIISGTARVLWNRDESYYAQAPWRGTRALDGGCLMNQCIHNIDLLQWMIGSDVENVTAELDTFSHDIEGEDFGALLIRFKNKAIGIVEGSVCVYPKNLEETLSVFGEKGTVVIGGLAVSNIKTWRFADGKDSEEEMAGQGWKDPDSVYGYGHTPLFKNMIDAINHDKDPYVNGKEGRKGLDIILRAYAAARGDT
ncbi:MAG: Gfo/Idh/MocA family oxidoreductase [Eubacteriales bacterium]|nr:Gfo/Idh/MocA family oxidoreductase [Eubacteriales bacterium]